LSPNWIAKNLFGVSEGTEIEVQVPFNAVLPLKVRHGELVVESQNNRLQVECPPEFDRLSDAMKIGLRAIGELPKTPFSAVGFNVLFALTSTAEEIPAFRFDGYLDSTLRAADREVTMRSAQRKYRWGDGQVLVVVEESVEQPLKLAINLERQSRNEEELKTWLQMPIAEIVAEVNRIQGWF